MALRHDRITAPFLVDGPMDGETFPLYVEDVLAPTLSHGDIVIMDNVALHKVSGIREAIAARGATFAGIASLPVRCRSRHGIIQQESSP